MNFLVSVTQTLERLLVRMIRNKTCSRHVWFPHGNTVKSPVLNLSVSNLVDWKHISIELFLKCLHRKKNSTPFFMLQEKKRFKLWPSKLIHSLAASKSLRNITALRTYTLAQTGSFVYTTLYTFEYCDSWFCLFWLLTGSYPNVRLNIVTFSGDGFPIVCVVCVCVSEDFAVLEAVVRSINSKHDVCSVLECVCLQSQTHSEGPVLRMIDVLHVSLVTPVLPPHTLSETFGVTGL